MESVRNQMDAAARNLEEVTPNVRRWITDVDEVLEKAQRIIHEIELEGKVSCSNVGSFLRFRYRRNQKASKLTTVAVKFREEANWPEFHLISYRPAPASIETATSEKVFESRRQTMNQIIEALSDDLIMMVGVYGMAGVGKTKLVKHVANRVQQSRLFDVTVTATVSPTPNLKEIQGEIADMLGLKFAEETEKGRAARLGERLMSERRVLIILDDIWGRIDLESVGIPTGDKHKGCKILVISRTREVLNDMNSQIYFLVEPLSSEEAFHLFKEMIGNNEPAEGSELAIQIADKCGGLPSALIQVGSRLRNSSLFEWRDVWRLLTRLTADHDDPLQGVLSSFKLSYDYLESEELKYTFILIGVLGDQTCDQDLLKCYLGLSLFKGTNTVEEARIRLYMLINSLKKSCLLLDIDQADENFATMHILVRRLAVSLASRVHHMFVIGKDDQLKELPDPDLIKNSTAISLLGSHIHELPENLECPKLRLLHVYDENRYVRVADRFFQRIQGLEVLDLVKMQLSQLPPSLHLLTNIQTLRLDQCMLGDISMIGVLTSLKVLSLASTNVDHLPREIAQLTRLCLLDLSNCSKLDVIPPNVISNLTKLEELYMRNSFVRWEVEGADERTNASIDELSQLYNLTALEIHIPDAEVLPNKLLLGKLVRYSISIGHGSHWSPKYEISRSLKLKLNTGSRHLEQGLQLPLKRAEELWLGELKGVKNILYDIDKEGFPMLKHLHVEDNSEIECIVNTTMHWASSIAFPLLESIVLNDVRSLGELCSSQLSMTSFSNLRVVKVRQCDNLKFVLSSSMARGLLQLKELEVSQCSSMAAILAAPDVIQFPQLQTLTLQALPKFTGFSSDFSPNSSMEVIEHSNMEVIVAAADVVQFPQLHTLTMQALPKLMGFSSVFRGESLMGQVGSKEIIQMNFRLFKFLTVCDCNSLSFLFSYDIAEGLEQVQKIEISDCVELAVVIKEEAEERDKIVFPLLSSLKLSNLPKLSCISPRLSFLVCQSLRELTIEACPKLENFEFVNSENQKPKTTKRRLQETFSMRKLETPLCSILKESVASSLVLLQELSIISCRLVEEIVVGESREAALTNKIEFPKVTTLSFQNLPNLVSFCSAGCSAGWPALKNVRVEVCPKIRRFGLGLVDRHNLKSVDVKDCLWQEELNIESIIAYLFQLSDPFSTCQEFSIESSEELRKILAMDLRPSYFSQLKSFNAKSCNDELIVFMSHLLSRSNWLEQLKIEQCNLLKHVYNLTEFVANDEGSGKFLSRLKRMTFWDLPELTCVWNKDPTGILGLSNLENIDIQRCGFLKNLFTTSVAENLHKLHALKIHSCLLIEEVVAVESEGEDMQKRKIVLPQLEQLELIGLSNIKKFHAGSYIFEFPCLESLRIQDCPNMKAFTTGFLSTKVTSMKESRDKEMLDGVMVEFTKLQNLKLVNVGDIEEIWQGMVPARSVSELSELEVDFCGKLTYVISYNVLPRLQNLEKMVVKNCDSVREVFQLHGKFDSLSPMLSRLRELVLTSLPNLMHVINMESVAGMRVFENLQVLQVNGCDCLRTLFLPFAANSLKLREVEISDCQVLEEIHVRERGGETDEKILFTHLSSIIFRNLPKLSTFSLLTFELPSSVSLRVENCPALNSFLSGFHGILNLPAAVDSFFTNLESFDTLEELHIIHQDGVQKIWNDKLLYKSFSELKFLVVENSSKLLNALPYCLLVSLKKLEKITVNSCDTLKLVLDLEEKDFPDKCTELLPHKLKHLFSLQTAKYLEHLELLKLYGCDAMEEVLVSEKQWMAPMVRVKEIPKLEKFSQGSQLTPKLKAVCETYITKYWQGDLNATIKYLHKKNEDEQFLKAMHEGTERNSELHVNNLQGHALVVELSKILKEQVTTQQGERQHISKGKELVQPKMKGE
ncbi:Disease resistance protein [Quillaja saponaria]|uniref:Disease resistance protein n=1 Tax=Quillaja saponaria TaxID=32244 RepID=A0AAD7Q284_QUISA|nr:Disease resistance protein [Quillaja saponaria]